MKAISRDLSSEIKVDDNVEKRFNELLSEFLSAIAVKIEKLPVAIRVSVETEDFGWWFSADIQDG